MTDSIAATVRPFFAPDDIEDDSYEPAWFRAAQNVAAPARKTS